MDGLALLDAVPADVLLEATPVNLRHGQPGLDTTRAALRRGMPVVLANKGPLALAFQELATLARESRASLRYSACVGGALPTINIGVRDLAGARVTRVEAMVNGTCQGILRLMETGRTFAQALAEMQSRGIVEADPSLDIDGWDAAAKLTIIANAVLRRPTTIADVQVTGIRSITLDDLRAADARGERIVLLGIAEPAAADWSLRVAPVSVPRTHPMARLSGDEMGVVYHTDISGVISAAILETDAMPTAAAMLRDVLAQVNPAS
jgi:homoserine dehydrogenase